MTTALFTHSDCLEHVTPDRHPEHVNRLRAIEEALAGPTFAALDRREAPLCDLSEIERCHPSEYIAKIEAVIPESGLHPLDADTHVSPGSFTAARRSVGGAIAAVDAVLGGDVSNAFVATRPPGHHAETAKPMGFCLFGNAALAAKYALDAKGLSRVAVIDFDVHHGNGTQDLLWDEPRALLATSQQIPLWPGTGEAHERGGHDNVINLPLAPQSDGRVMRANYEAHIFPAIKAFRPELLIISAGFDAHRDDPLAELMWSDEDFTWLAKQICALSAELCDGRVVSVLEGGYNLEALGRSVAAYLKVMMDA